MKTFMICGKLFGRFFVLALLLFFTGLPAFAQWTSQTIHLKPGWNAVFLEVQPQPNDCNTLFKGIPVESVWMWNRRFSTVQYIKDPAELVPEQPEWLTYIPGNKVVTNLFTLQGGRPYLIKRSGANPVDWKVVGRPVVRALDWNTDSFNFVGFCVDDTSSPTFEAFFAPSLAHKDKGQPIYRLNDAGKWEPVEPKTARLRRGEAYWVYCKGTSTYSGPLTITFEQGQGIDFGRTLMEQTLRLRNESATAKTVTLKVLASTEPVDTTQPALAGPVPLSYWKSSEKNLSEAGWTPFPAVLSVSLGSKTEVAIRLEVRRRDMAQGRAGLYQSLLEVADGNGSTLLLPVTARGRQPSFDGGGIRREARLLSAQTTTSEENAGLWVGTVSVNNVSQPANSLKPNEAVETASEFQFRILVHVNEVGKARFLQQVVLMWKDGTYKQDPNDREPRIVDEPGHYVLVTDDALLQKFSGSTLRDGKSVGRRISSAAFALDEPKLMTGTFGKELVVDLELDYDHRLNPFKHRYHPDHNNLREDYKTPLPEGIESFTVKRKITLSFGDKDPDGLAIAGLGDRYFGGIYKETISGIHKQAIEVKGTFRLHHVSRVPVLNDGQ
ncbi:hypothetical protein HYR99_41685 [Candidatus Poribacteria bacterium]|nr:hypothetical protein [Candidatus Poribacteria bacterium]